MVAEGPLADLAARVAGIASAPAPAGAAARTRRPRCARTSSAGVAWLAGMCEAGLGGCLADDMGLGKTIQVIALHLHRREAQGRPDARGVPGVAARHLGAGGAPVRPRDPGPPLSTAAGGTCEDLAADEIVLVTYGVVLRDSARLAEVGWGLVVADEAQHAKNPLSRTARELRALPAPARIALTGTPVENRLSELWAILDWTTPGLLGHLEAFTRRVAVPVERYRDAEATARFAALVRPFLLRRQEDPTRASRPNCRPRPRRTCSSR